MRKRTSDLGLLSEGGSARSNVELSRGDDAPEVDGLASNELKWHERPVRMMRLDYLDALDRMKNADLDALARTKRDDWNINCEWVVGTPGIAPGLGYLTTFDTPKFEKYPSLGEFDMLRDYLPHARKYGIHVLAYLNMHWFACDFADAHPGWEQICVGRRSPTAARTRSTAAARHCASTAAGGIGRWR